ncbi:MAG TPA: acyl-CoA dehydrogenase family protein [Solirubrobacteraceae bacterium]|nr:acyl-CoA dehydrogenase family protein [Solirubrobacteraceae bacterium]
MSEAGSATSAAPPQRDLVAAARELSALAQSGAAAAEARGALGEDLVEAFHDSGLWAMWMPRELGGFELEPVPSLEVLEHISYGDASAGWVLMAAALATGVDGAYIGDEAVAQLYGPGRLRVHSGAGTQPGRAVATDGGYTIAGNWRFASGIKHSAVLHTAAIVEGANEPPRIFVTPVEDMTLDDNWDVMGLRATGSIDYSSDGLFVAEPFSYIATTNEPLRGGAIFTMGIAGLGVICHTGWALGVARRCIDELRTLLEGRRGRPDRLAQSDRFHYDYASAEAKLRAARAFVYETWAEVQETVRSGDPLSLEQNTLYRLALQHVTSTALEVAAFVYEAGGTTALRAGAIQRCFRDIHAGAQHMICSPPVRQAAGRVLAGLAPEEQWLFMMLVKPS